MVCGGSCPNSLQRVCLGTASLLEGIDRDTLAKQSQVSAILYDWTSATLKSKMGNYCIQEIMKKRRGLSKEFSEISGEFSESYLQKAALEIEKSTVSKVSFYGDDD